MNLTEEMINKAGQLAEYALLAEVGTTPKPGLVDKHDSGAHKDMDYDTFIASTNAILPYLKQMMVTGSSWTAPPDSLLSGIRPIGIKAEQAMFQATNRVNTHKGMIFSLGILMAVSGWYLNRFSSYHSEAVLDLCGRFTYEELELDFQKMDLTNPRTHGEKLYVQYGYKGIRGEVQEGFPAVKHHALPALRDYFSKNADNNSAYLHTLLVLMSVVDDTNVLIRTDARQLEYVKQQARHLLQLGGNDTKIGQSQLQQTNLDFIAKNISPGGCADLLAVTIFLHQMEQTFKRQ